MATYMPLKTQTMEGRKGFDRVPISADDIEAHAHYPEPNPWTRGRLLLYFHGFLLAANIIVGLAHSPWTWSTSSQDPQHQFCKSIRSILVGQA